MWKTLSDTVESVAVFRGPQTYISPNWYPSKRQHGKVVPTWDYAVVHAHGRPRFTEDAAWLLGNVSELTDRHESAQTRRWKVADAPRDFIEKMLAAIVGIEIPITRIQGKWKVSQNRPRADRHGVVAGLEARGDGDSDAIAALVRQTVE